LLLLRLQLLLRLLLLLMLMILLLLMLLLLVVHLLPECNATRTRQRLFLVLQLWLQQVLGQQHQQVRLNLLALASSGYGNGRSDNGYRRNLAPSGYGGNGSKGSVGILTI